MTSSYRSQFLKAISALLSSAFTADSSYVSYLPSHLRIHVIIFSSASDPPDHRQPWPRLVPLPPLAIRPFQERDRHFARLSPAPRSYRSRHPHRYLCVSLGMDTQFFPEYRREGTPRRDPGFDEDHGCRSVLMFNLIRDITRTADPDLTGESAGATSRPNSHLLTRALLPRPTNPA